MSAGMVLLEAVTILAALAALGLACFGMDREELGRVSEGWRRRHRRDDQ